MLLLLLLLCRQVLLLSVYEEVCSCLHWDQVPLWRFIAVPRDVDRWYYGFDSLLDEVGREGAAATAHTRG